VVFLSRHIVTRPPHFALPKQALEAIQMIQKMVRDRGGEIPQGVRKQDLDQVYKRVKDSLSKPVRSPNGTARPLLPSFPCDAWDLMAEDLPALPTVQAA
jgi:hypothetical protein